MEPRKSSTAVELKSVDRYEFYVSRETFQKQHIKYTQAGFLKSSPKITLHPKAPKRASIQIRSHSTIPNPQRAPQSPSRSSTTSPVHRGASPFSNSGSGSSTPRSKTATWVCTICSFSNPVPANFDTATANSNTPLPACVTCGVKPSFPHVLKASIANAAGRQGSQSQSQAAVQPLLESHGQYRENSSIEYIEAQWREESALPAKSRFQCPRCTFLNHPSLLACELCGAPLLTTESKAADVLGERIRRPESPGPSLDSASLGIDHDTESVKFSFHAGGEKIFHERLKGAMVQRKWLLQNAPPVPDSSPGNAYSTAIRIDGHIGQPSVRARTVGIAGLERQGLELRRKNEAVIGSAFEDLDALMASAKEIVALAESFAKKSDEGSADANQLIAESAKALDMVTTKDMLGSSAGSESLYLSEMARNLAEYLTDDAKGILRKEGGIMSLVDLWAVFNRARGGVELISPMEFEKAARLWEKLRLPVRLRQFKNGLLVVQQADRTDDKTIAQLLSWLQELHTSSFNPEVGWGHEVFGRGVTAQEAAQRFGWSVGVASEELDMAEEKGALCREEGIEGLRFWENWIVDDESDGFDDDINVDPFFEVDQVMKNLEDMGIF
ncbi:MAG: hypothetical protein ASARMPREDX12_003659 [Alectoria sarmentosa]|nr:MAG: hypothetical protein ASARMPREDX12_003659 [Alectoria sarmentosa]